MSIYVLFNVSYRQKGDCITIKKSIYNINCICI